MAELSNPQEPTFPSKRKPEDLNATDNQEPPNKAPKLATLDPNSKNHTDSDEPPTTGNDAVQEGAENYDNQLQNDVVGNNDNDDEDDEEEANGEVEVDRKGKGILRDDKGKGKLIEEEGDDEDDDDDSDDDDDDSDEDGGVSGGDSDFSDDPLAEVDLNNILPSRTRRRTVHPGLHIASDAGNVAAADDDDEDDSDA